MYQASQVALMVKNPHVKRCRFDPWVRKILSGGGHVNPIPVFLPGESRGERRVTVHRIAKSWTQVKQLNTHAHTSYTLEHISFSQ